MFNACAQDDKKDRPKTDQSVSDEHNVEDGNSLNLVADGTSPDSVDQIVNTARTQTITTTSTTGTISYMRYPIQSALYISYDSSDDLTADIKTYLGSHSDYVETYPRLTLSGNSSGAKVDVQYLNPCSNLNPGTTGGKWNNTGTGTWYNSLSTTALNTLNCTLSYSVPTSGTAEINNFNNNLKYAMRTICGTTTNVTGCSVANLNLAPLSVSHKNKVWINFRAVRAMDSSGNLLRDANNNLLRGKNCGWISWTEGTTIKTTWSDYTPSGSTEVSSIYENCSIPLEYLGIANASTSQRQTYMSSALSYIANIINYQTRKYTADNPNTTDIESTTTPTIQVESSTNYPTRKFKFLSSTLNDLFYKHVHLTRDSSISSGKKFVYKSGSCLANYGALSACNDYQKLNGYTSPYTMNNTPFTQNTTITVTLNTSSTRTITLGSALVPDRVFRFKPSNTTYNYIMYISNNSTVTPYKKATFGLDSTSNTYSSSSDLLQYYFRLYHHQPDANNITYYTLTSADGNFCVYSNKDAYNDDFGLRNCTGGDEEKFTFQ